MLQQAIVTIVDFCTRYAAQIIGIAALFGLAAAVYADGHFAIDADVNKLISKDLPWRQREVAFEKSFPPKEETILAIIDAPTSELATQATAALIQKLSDQKDHFHSILEAGGGPFFQKNGLLFLPAPEVVALTKKLGEAKPLIQTLAQDSNLRGLTTALNYGLIGVRMNQFTLDNLSGTLNMVSDTLDEAIAGRPASFSWRAMLNGRPPTPDERRRFLEIRPVLDYAALMPGKVATDAIRQAVADLDLGARYGARLRLTGPVAIADEEYATLEEGAFTNTTVTIVVVLTILWLALRSFGIILAVAISLVVGLSITAAIGLALVGALNLISIAFAVLFIGLGVDFGIQFSVRYRQERFKMPDLRTALTEAGARAGFPLTLAAAAVAAGFLSFLPTPYRGVSELGEIAGAGMIIAYLASITVLPALLYVFHPPGEPDGLGFAWLAPVDAFLENHRGPIITATFGLAIAGSPLLYFLHFDFNPMNLRSPKVESIATYLDLRRDPNAGANSVNVLVPSVAAADQAAGRLKALPEVERVMTIADFVPADQAPTHRYASPQLYRNSPRRIRRSASAPKPSSSCRSRTNSRISAIFCKQGRYRSTIYRLNLSAIGVARMATFASRPSRRATRTTMRTSAHLQERCWRSSLTRSVDRFPFSSLAIPSCGHSCRPERGRWGQSRFSYGARCAGSAMCC